MGMALKNTFVLAMAHVFSMTRTSARWRDQGQSMPRCELKLHLERKMNEPRLRLRLLTLYV